MVKATDNYKYTFAKRVSFASDGTRSEEDDKSLVEVTLGRRFKDVMHKDGPKGFLQEIVDLDGVDLVEPTGNYTFRVRIAVTFNPQEVLDELATKLDAATSAIVIPLKKSAKIVVP